MEWLRGNLTFAVTVIIMLTGLFAQWTILQTKVDLVDSLADQMEEHQRDALRHVDPIRDERRWQDLQYRLQRIEDKLDAK